MSASVTINNSTSAGGKSNTQTLTIQGSQIVLVDVSIPKAFAGALSIRTDNTNGTLTITGTNGIITGERLDLYWAGGQRHGITAGTVAGASVPISGGSGTNLPAAATVIQAAIAVQYPFQIVGNNIEVLTMWSAAFGTFDLVTSAPADALSANIFPQGVAVLDIGVNYTWFTNNGLVNPIAGQTIANVWLSHNNTAQAQIMRVAALIQ